MSAKSYTLDSSEKATPVMIGTADMLLWGDLVTKEQVQMRGFLNTLAEAFVPIHDVKILFLLPAKQIAPVERDLIYVKREEILLFYSMSEQEPLPEETEVRRFEPVELIVGSFQIEGAVLKSPVATMQNMLLVTKDAYMFFYKATIRHVANPWLGTFSTNMVQVRMDRLGLALR
jgi:hypothetical protein